MLEELEAQTGAWFLLEFLPGKKLIGDELARGSYVDMIARYVDSDTVVPHKLIAERMLRQAKASFVYTVKL